MQQIWLYELIRDMGCSLSLVQAEKLKKVQADHKLTKEVMEVILTEDNGPGPSIYYIKYIGHVTLLSLQIRSWYCLRSLDRPI